MPQSGLGEVLRFLQKACALQGTCDLSDRDLLERFLSNRDEGAFTFLVRRHGPMILGACRRLLGDYHDAEDALQAAFLVLIRRTRSIRKKESVGSWLFGVAQRIALRARTQNAARRRREREAGSMRAERSVDDLTVQELRSALDEAIGALPEKYRGPIVLCYLESKSHDRAARELGWPKSSLESRLTKAREMLRRKLERRGITLAVGALVTALTEMAAAAPLSAILTIKTVKAATLIATGKVVAGGCISTHVLALAEETVLAIKTKLVVMVMGIGLAVGGVGWAGYGGLMEVGQEGPAATGQHIAVKEQAGGAAKKEQVNATDSGPRLDADGDPLPPGAINRIGSSRLRHFADVTSMLYTPDGKAIVSTSGHCLYLWDAATGKQRWRLGMAEGRGPFHSTPVVVASSDSTKVAVLTEREFLLLDTSTSKQLARHQLRGPNVEGFFRCMAIAPDMGMFALSHDESTVKLIDAVSGKEKVRIVAGPNAETQFPTAIEFSADGKALYVLTSRKEDQKQIVVIGFDTQTGKEIQTFQALKTEAANSHDPSFPKQIIRSHDNQLLAVMEHGIILRTNAKIALLDLKTGKQRHFIEADLDRVNGGAFSPDGSLFAVASLMPYIVLFDTTSGQERGRLPAPPGTRSLTFSPDGKMLAFGDGACIALCDVTTGKHKPPSSDANALGRIRFTNNGTGLLSVRAGVGWWDVTSGNPIRHLPADLEWFNISSVSPDGKLLVASLVNCDMVLIDAVTGELVRSLDGHKILHPVTVFSPDGTKLYSAGRHLVADKAGVARLDPRIIILNVATGKALNVLQSDADQVDQLAVSPDGRWLASGARYEDTKNYDIRLWDLVTGKVAHRLTTRLVASQAMLFSADGSRLVSVAGEWGRNNSGAVQLWDVATGKEVGVCTSHDEAINCAAMTPDGHMLATGGEKTLRLWEVATGTERGRITGHVARVSSLDFSPNGNLLAAASGDAPVYLWNPYALKSKSSGTKLTKDEREKLWQRLADADAAVAFQAVCELITRPGEAVAILEEGWERRPRTTAKQMHKWVEDLSSEQFAVRKTATEGLERFAAEHEDLLKGALKQASTLEMRQRLEKIVSSLDPPRLRRSRMMEVLEQLRTAPARQFLQTLAEQKEDAQLAREAAAGLKRLEQRK